jgi:streptogramin lyase
MRSIVLGLTGLLLATAAVTTQFPSGTASAAEGGRGGAPRAPRNPVIPPASAMLPYTPAAEPTVPGEAYGSVAGIAQNSKDHLYVYQRTDNALIEFDQDGRFVRNFGPGMQVRAHSVRIDADDNIWLADVNANTVTKLSPSGQVLMTLGTKGQTGTWNEAAGAHLFNQPTDVAFGKNGDVFVSTGHGGPDPRVVRFDRTGKFLNTWPLTRPDQPRVNIHTITVGPDGNVYAGDREVMLLRVFRPDGAHVRDIKTKNLICGLYVDAKGDLWMTAGQDGMIMAMNWDGTVKGWTGKLGKGVNEYGEAHYMTLSRDLGTIYVSDTVNNRIQKLVRTRD